ncbi:MAG: T9SS type A sorting domain-containing protein [Bacteroidales bacterium]|nr:T9SS type A sorting domain-containing protein [Bacteroidales bacterium]
MSLISKIFISLILLLSFLKLEGQRSIVSLGGDAFSDEYAVSYSVGNNFVATVKQADFYVSFGMQHPLINSTTGSDFPAESDFQTGFTLYPNPVTDFFYLVANSPVPTNISFKLFDIKGTILIQKQMKDLKEKITVANYSGGSYLLKIYEDNQEKESFIIIKR